ncbi:MAG: hypothetical protein WC467_00840 [Patescibacteria group bacterium]
MDSALQLYGSFILTIMSFVLPILAIALSIFSEGSKFLLEKYENEKKQSDQNLVNETKKMEEEKNLDYAGLQKTIKTLKKNIRIAEVKINYLKPDKLFVKIFIPFFFAFILLMATLIIFAIEYRLLLLALSLIAFIIGIYILWKSILILIEVFGSINQTKKDYEEKVISLLSDISTKNGNSVSDLFIKEEKIGLIFYGKYLKKDETFDFSVNKKYDIPVSINNSSDIMAEKVEIGLILSQDFLVEKTTNLSIYATEDKQIIRLNSEIVQAHENQLKNKISLTFLKSGNYNIEAFVKGKNVIYHRFAFCIKVIE